MAHFVTLDIVDGGSPKGERTFTQVEVEVGSFGQIEIDDDDFDSDDFKIYILPEGVFLQQRWGDGVLAVNGTPIKKQQELNVGDVITQGGTTTITVVKMGEKDEMPEEGSRYIAVDILDKCPHCGSGQPMNGPLSDVGCSSCHKSCHPKPAYWETVLEDLVADYHTGGGSFSLNFQINVRWKAAPPACKKCKAELPADQVPTGSTEDIICPKCATPNSTYPAPEWLSTVLPSISQIFCADRETSQGGGEIETGGAKPVVLSCPSCKGSLKVSSGTDRTVTCQYCNSDVYLPDDLWARLHPVKTATTWYFRLEGPSKKQLEEEGNRLEKIEEVRTEFKNTVQEARSEKTSKVVGIGVPVAIGVIVAVVVLGGAIMEGISDAEDPTAGVQLIPGAPTGTSAAGANWAADQLSPTRVNVNNQWFSLYAPAGIVPTNDGTSVQWQNATNAAGQAYLYVRVSATPRSPTNPREAVTSAATGQPQPSNATRNGVVPGGFSVTLQTQTSNRMEVVTYKTRSGLAPGSPGLECRAIMQTNTGAPLAYVDQVEAYLVQICGSLTAE